jgi:hypothetical protein
MCIDCYWINSAYKSQRPIECTLSTLMFAYEREQAAWSL